MQERGVCVDHSSINRWAIRFLPLLEKRHKRPVGVSWRMDKTYIKVKGTWKYLYRAVDRLRKRDGGWGWIDKTATRPNGRRLICSSSQIAELLIGVLVTANRRTIALGVARSLVRQRMARSSFSTE